MNIVFLGNQLKERRGFNKTTVAVAHKNARIIWSMLRNETEYHRHRSSHIVGSASVLVSSLTSPVILFLSGQGELTKSVYPARPVSLMH